MERDCESKLSKLNIEQNACIYHFGASVIHGQRSNILRLLYISPHFFLSLDMKKSACSTFPEKDKTGTFTGSIPLVMNLYVW